MEFYMIVFNRMQKTRLNPPNGAYVGRGGPKKRTDPSTDHFTRVENDETQDHSHPSLPSTSHRGGDGLRKILRFSEKVGSKALSLTARLVGFGAKKILQLAGRLGYEVLLLTFKVLRYTAANVLKLVGRLIHNGFSAIANSMKNRSKNNSDK